MWGGWALGARRAPGSLDSERCDGIFRETHKKTGLAVAAGFVVVPHAARHAILHFA